MLKASNYNFLEVTDDGKLLIYNSRTGAFAAVPEKAGEDIKALLANPEPGSGADTEIIENLKKGGFLLDEGIDELSEIQEDKKKQLEKMREFLYRVCSGG